MFLILTPNLHFDISIKICMGLKPHGFDVIIKIFVEIRLKLNLILISFFNVKKIATLRLTSIYRCKTPTQTSADPPTHNGTNMIRASYHRRPRDHAESLALLGSATNSDLSKAAQMRLLNPHALWPEGSALHDLRLCNAYMQVHGDSLHVLDGGITKILLEHAGNYLQSTGGWDEVC